MPSPGEPPLPGTHSAATGYSPHRYHFGLLNNFIHTDLELLYQLADGIDGEDADPGAAQELRDLEAAGTPLPWAVL